MTWITQCQRRGLTSRMLGGPQRPQSILPGAVQGVFHMPASAWRTAKDGGVPGTHGPPLSHQDHSTSQEGGFRQKISPNVIFSLPVSD